MLPNELLAGAGLPLTSSTNDRKVTVTLSARRGNHVVASQSRTLTFLADDGTYAQAQAPSAPGHVALGRDVTVHYDLTGHLDSNRREQRTGEWSIHWLQQGTGGWREFG